MYRSMQTSQGIRLGEEQVSELSFMDTLLMAWLGCSNAEGQNPTLHPFKVHNLYWESAYMKGKSPRSTDDYCNFNRGAYLTWI